MKENNFYLLSIRECIDRIEDYTKSGKDAFFQSTLIQDAVVRNLEKISYAAEKVNDETRADMSSIPWKELAAMRLVLVYPDRTAVWNTVEFDLPKIKDAFTPLSV